MKDEEIDQILKSAGQASQDPDPRVLARIGASIKASSGPVRPVAPMWLLAGGLILVCATVALAGAARAGFFGVAKMNPLERALVFPALGLFASLTAVAFIHQMIPASRIRISPGALLALSSVAMAAVFADLFRDYHTAHFFSAGIICLATGLVHAVPAGVLSWMIVRRGFAVNPTSAGVVAGTLAGLAGVTLLELHCPNFQAAHILVWHTAVIPVSAALGGLVGWRLHLRARAESR